MPPEPEIYRFASAFTAYPGGRYRDEGPHSGQEFYETVLLPRLNAQRRARLVLNDVYGFATAFLDGAFGEFAARHGVEAFHANFEIQSDDDPSLVAEIEDCLARGASEAKGGRDSRVSAGA